MSLKYKQWWYQCQLECNRNLEQKKQIASALIILAAEWEKSRKKQSTAKRFWVHPVLQLRKFFGFYEAIFPTLAVCDDMFKNYMRMTLSQFEDLLRIVAPVITKKFCVRIPIPAAARLAMTLRYLATGDCINSTTYAYLVSLTSVINIIRETCEVIWCKLVKDVMPGQLSKEDWLNIANQFEEIWNFPHCIGAIDRKHVAIQCPDHTGSKNFNYKSFHSIVLLALCDAKYKFLFVDIGAPGRASDGGVFRNSQIGYKLSNNQMNLPDPIELTADGNPIPYFLVGDEAFQLSSFLMRPYPGRGGISYDATIFNYHLSRARRTIENAFGILVQRWRVLKKAIECCKGNAIKKVKAVVCLHNWLRETDENDEYIPAVINEETLSSELEDSALNHALLRSSNFRSEDVYNIREELCSYFSGEGAVTFQYNAIEK